MKTIRQLAVWNTVSFAGQLIYAYLSQTQLAGSETVKQVSDRYTSLFTPAPFTFSIWGLIYTGLTIFCLVHLVAAFRHGTNNYYNRETFAAGPWLIITNLFSMAWFYSFTHEYLALSEIFIAIQLIGVMVIHSRLNMYDRHASIGSKLATQIPFSIYLGWLSVASIANTSLYLRASNWWTGLGLEEITWTIIMIAVATLLAIVMVIFRRSIWYGLVLVWALFGILSARAADQQPDYTVIIQIAWTAMALITLVCLLQFIQNLLSRPSTSHHPFPAPSESLK